AALARLLRRPPLEGVAGGIDRGLGVLDRGARHRGDPVLGRGIEHVEAAAVGGLAPLAADPEIGRNIGEQIFIHGTFPFLVARTSVFRLSRAAARMALGSCELRSYEAIARFTRSTIRSTVGSAMSSSTSAAGSGMCGVVIRTGGPSRS